jgi:hypothetical protein
MRISQNLGSRAEKIQCFQWFLLPETFSSFQFSTFSFQNLVFDFSAENYSTCDFSNSGIHFVNGVNKSETKSVLRNFDFVKDQPVSFFRFPNVSECNAVIQRASVKPVFKMKRAESPIASSPKNIPAGKKAQSHQPHEKFRTQNFRLKIQSSISVCNATTTRGTRLLAQRISAEEKVLALAPCDFLPALSRSPGTTIDFNQKASVSPRLGYFFPNEQSEPRFFGNDLAVQTQIMGRQI